MDFGFLQLLYIFFASAIGEAFGTMFGGGSFFIQPALLAAKVPPNIAVANDVTAAVFANLAFLWFYRKEKKSITIQNYKSIFMWMAPASVMGAIIGGHVLYALPQEFIRGIIITICSAGFVHALIKIRKPALEVMHVSDGFIPHWRLAALAGALGLGFYDGVSGAGGGVLLILLLSSVFSLDMKTIFSVANVISSVSLLTAGVTFLFLGLVSWQLQMVMIPGALIAGALGAKVAIFLPEKTLRIIYAGLIFGLIGYLLIGG